MWPRLSAALVPLLLVCFLVAFYVKRQRRHASDDIPIQAALSEVDALPSLNGSVSCGEHLAPSCSACGNASSGCLGDCVWLWSSSHCVPIVPAEPLEPPFTVPASAWRFEPGVDVLQVVESSPLSAAALSLLLASAVTRANATVELPHLDISSVLRVARGSHAALAPPPESASNYAAAWHIALLREPLESFEAEMLPHPELCTPVVTENGLCTPSALSALPTGRPAARVARLLVCCANPLSRSLIATLPRSEATERCAGRPMRSSGGGVWNDAECTCDAPMMQALARRALLRLSWFGLLRTPTASLALLGRTLGKHVPPLPPTTLRAMSHPSWPSPPVRGSARRARGLTPAQARAWRTANEVDLAIYELAEGVLAFRLRSVGIPDRLAGAMARRIPVIPPRMEEEVATSSVRASRVFATEHGDGRDPAVVQPPLVWRRQVNSLVFVHIAKCGGTSFNRRLMSLDVGLPCECNAAWLANAASHNGHKVVRPRSCACPRVPTIEYESHWSTLAMKRLTHRQRLQLGFLQRHWLISPDTTGWLGGVHAPVRVLQAYVMLSARLTSLSPLSSGLHYVTLLREPTRRFVSEFYETYDGWESVFGTPPRLPKDERCSAQLPEPLRTRARAGIDNTTKPLYDELFKHWISCTNNMAASRQTRALSYAAIANADSPEGENKHDAALRNRLCASLPGRADDPRCSLHIARAALYRFTLVGLNSERCATERLLEAQFGLSFRRVSKELGAAATDGGKGAHRVAKLDYEHLDARTRRRVRWLNRDDLVLYREATHLFHRRLRAYGIPLGARC